jgi:hypothetical protein
MSQACATASCRCGRVNFALIGKPIVHASCYCDGCRTAGLRFAEGGSPAIVSDDGGTDVVLYRKDRVGPVAGTDLLREYRLTPASPTRRMVATCCNTPMFLEFTPGHWLTLYRGRLTGAIPPLEMRIMTRARPSGPPLPGDLPNYAAHPPRFMFRLLAAFGAMGFRKPQIAW